jgi:hypothetical protein
VNQSHYTNASQEFFNRIGPFVTLGFYREMFGCDGTQTLKFDAYSAESRIISLGEI